jgi:hypothetical protein
MEQFKAMAYLNGIKRGSTTEIFKVQLIDDMYT